MQRHELYNLCYDLIRDYEAELEKSGFSDGMQRAMSMGFRDGVNRLVRKVEADMDRMGQS